MKDLPLLQDMPPPGGFPSVRIDRRLPSTGPTGVTLLLGACAVLTYGYYKVRISQCLLRPTCLLTSCYGLQLTWRPHLLCCIGVPADARKQVRAVEENRKAHVLPLGNVETLFARTCVAYAGG